jgi:hypothetical protein
MQKKTQTNAQSYENCNIKRDNKSIYEVIYIEAKV